MISEFVYNNIELVNNDWKIIYPDIELDFKKTGTKSVFVYYYSSILLAVNNNGIITSSDDGEHTNALVNIIKILYRKHKINTILV